ncbi:MAG: hypothetical protein HQL36_08465, partial [Alphaproteobacteria bacterium]|nr:hypothetical protein [Alphaproteobacteria bacterium]
MAYSQEISRECPGAFLFLVDHSRSMNKDFGVDENGNPVSRAVLVAEALNSTLEELVNRCMRDEGVRDYFDIGVIGYGETHRPRFCWEDGLAGRSLVPISEVAANARVDEQEITTMVRGQPVSETVTVSHWITPTAIESTPMNAAVKLAYATLQEWIYRNPNS